MRMPKKLNTFFHVFTNSFKPTYYKKVVKTKFSFSFKYLVFLQFLISLILLIKFIVPVTTFDQNTVFDQVKKIYPQDLAITYDQSGISVNQDLPYTIKTPKSWNGEDAEFGLVTFASDRQVTGIKDFYDMNSVVVITESSLYALKDVDSREVSVYEIPANPEEPYVITRQDADQLVTKVQNIGFIKNKLYVPALFVLALLIAYPMSLLGRMFILLVYTVIVLIITVLFMKTKKLNFSKIYQICIHAFTPFMLLYLLNSMLDSNLLRGSGLVFIAMTAWTLFIISKLPNKKK